VSNYFALTTIFSFVGREGTGSNLEVCFFNKNLVEPVLLIIYPQKLALTPPTSGGRSEGIVRLRTKATVFSFFSLVCVTYYTFLL
jgi:hypothetical protein